jgi:O-antigen/teichoic acid export membrane protein
VIKVSKYKEFSWVAFGQIIAAIASLALVRVMTELLNPSQYGEVALAMTIVAFATQVLMGGLNVGIGRYYAIARKDSMLTSYVFSVKDITTNIGKIILTIGLFFLILFYWSGNNKLAMFSVLVTIIALLSSYNSVFNNVINTARRRIVSSLHLILEVLLKLIFLLIMLQLSFDYYKAEVVLMAFAISAFIIFLLYKKYVDSYIDTLVNDKKCDKDWVSDIWGYSKHFILWTVLIWVQQISERWLLQIYTTLEEVGIYAMLYTLGYAPVLMLFKVSIRFMYPIAYEKTEIQGGILTSQFIIRGRIKKMILIGSLIAIVGFFVTDIAHESLFYYLVSEEYREYSYLLKWFVFSGVLFGMGEVVVMKMQSDMKVELLGRVKSLIGIMGLSVNFIGVYYAGFYGMIAALVVFTIINLCAMYYASDYE